MGQKKKTGEKQPKETDKIKKKLKHVATLKRRIDNLIERLEYLESTMGSASTPNLTGLPGGGDGTSKTEREVAKKLELETQLRDLIDDEAENRRELEHMIGLMKKPDEQTIIEMRYFDEAGWWTICAVLYGKEDDYETNSQRYLKRAFKIHGSALQTLAKIEKENY